MIALEQIWQSSDKRCTLTAGWKYFQEVQFVNGRDTLSARCEKKVTSCFSSHLNPQIFHLKKIPFPRCHPTSRLSLSLSLCLCVSVSLCFCLCPWLYLSILTLSLCLCLHPWLPVSVLILCLGLSVPLSLSLSLALSMSLAFCFYFQFQFCLSVPVSLSLFIRQFLGLTVSVYRCLFRCAVASL